MAPISGGLVYFSITVMEPVIAQRLV